MIETHFRGRKSLAEPPRLFRLALDFPTDPSEQELADIRASFRPLSQENAGEPLVVPHCISLEFNEARKTVGTIKKCIYCRATESVPGTGERLSEEHFLPEGLGSRLVLLEASCKACEDRTHAFEEAILLHALRASRRKLKIRGKKRKRNEATFALTVVKPDGTETVEWRTLDVHPTVLFLPKFDAPGLLAGRLEGQFPNINTWSLLLGAILKSDAHFSSPVMDIAALAQLIGKIAHGFAVWQFGLDGFVPMLVELILHNFDSDPPHPDQFHLVGGDLRNFAPHTDRLHTLGWGFFENNGKTYLLVAARLFSYLGGPIYYAVAGYFTEEQLAKARAMSKAHGQASNATGRELSDLNRVGVVGINLRPELCVTRPRDADAARDFRLGEDAANAKDSAADDKISRPWREWTPMRLNRVEIDAKAILEPGDHPPLIDFGKHGRRARDRRVDCPGHMQFTPLDARQRLNGAGRRASTTQFSPDWVRS
jgi:hypothetical protein